MIKEKFIRKTLTIFTVVLSTYFSIKWLSVSQIFFVLIGNAILVYFGLLKKEKV